MGGGGAVMTDLASRSRVQMWSNTPLNELDLTKSEKGGPSYRSLPKNFPLLSCSEVRDGSLRLLMMWNVRYCTVGLWFC